MKVHDHTKKSNVKEQADFDPAGVEIAPDAGLMSGGSGKRDCRSDRILTVKGYSLSLLGKMLEYPRDDFAGKVEGLIEKVTEHFPGTAKALAQFADACRNKTSAEFEELYTRTFDLAAICSPYITGYIYGDENFDRGTFMALLGEKYDEMRFDAQGELPDHVVVLLRFASLLEEETLDELISFCLTAPISEMRERLEEAANPYAFVFAAISTVIKENRRVEGGGLDND